MICLSPGSLPFSSFASLHFCRFLSGAELFSRRRGRSLDAADLPRFPACAFSRVPISDKMRARHSTVVCLWVRENVIGEGKFTRQFSPNLPCNSRLQHGPRAMETCLDSFAPKAKELCGFLHCQIVNHASNQNTSESLGK